MSFIQIISGIFFALSFLFSSLSFSQELDPYEAGWQGERMCEISHEDDKNRILLCIFPPGTGHERHMHGPTYNYILEGARLIITDENGEQELTLETGLGYFSEGVTWHEAVNIGQNTFRVLLIEQK